MILALAVSFVDFGYEFWVYGCGCGCHGWWFVVTGGDGVVIVVVVVVLFLFFFNVVLWLPK